MDTALLHDANIVAAYLAQRAEVPSIDARRGGMAMILVGSAIIPTMRAAFDYLTHIESAETITLVLCGGIGHSTPLLRSAVIRAYPGITAKEVENLSEARIFEKAMRMAWPELCGRIERGEINLLVEEESTNCGANANLAVDLLRSRVITPDTLVVVQDPTMMRRTIASFEKAYEIALPHSRPKQIIPWSTFTPHLTFVDDEIQWNISDFCDKKASISELWQMDRFLGLINGEIARLNDDEDGYGPRGKGFIGHVEIPEEVLECWKRLKVIGGGRKAHP